MKQRFLVLTWLSILAVAPIVRAGQDVQTAVARQKILEAQREFNDGTDMKRAVTAATEAIADLQPRVGKDPSVRDLLVRALAVRARSHAVLGEKELAKADFQLLLSIAPDYTPPDTVGATALAEARKSTLGFLDLKVTPPDAPGARIELDGKPIERLTAPLAVLAGPHTIRATCSGCEPQTPTVEVPAGQKIEVPLELKRVYAVVVLTTSPDDVEIYVNGTLRGKTAPGPPPESWSVNGEKVPRSELSKEFLIDDAREGSSVKIVAKKPCYATRDFDPLPIKEVRDIYLTPIRLERTVGKVTFSGVDGASLVIDGEPRGSLTKSGSSVELCAGGHKIEITSVAGRDFRDLTVRNGDSVSIVPKLRPVVAILDVNGLPKEYVGPDAREEVAKRLETESLIFWPQSDKQAESARDAEKLTKGWLGFDIYRNPTTPEAKGIPGIAMVDRSARLVKGLNVQAVAELMLTKEAGRELNRFLLSILAGGSTVPDVLDVDLGSGPSVGAAIERLNAFPLFYRPSVGLSAADVHDVGAVVSRVDHGGPTERGGIVPGDVIATVGGRPVTSVAAFTAALAAEKKGETLVVGIRDRQDVARNVPLLIGTEPRLIAVEDESWLFNVLIAGFRSRLAVEDDPVVRLNLAVALMAVKNWAGALEELGRTTLPAGPGVSSGTVQFVTGECQAQLGRAEKAREAWQSVIGDSGSLLTEDGPAVSDLAKKRLATLGRTGGQRP
jgi:hypothetical protein